jgi:hypothetical protein
VALNAAVLFVVVFYVYPQKFMFDSVFAQFIPPLQALLERHPSPRQPGGQVLALDEFEHEARGRR